MRDGGGRTTFPAATVLKGYTRQRSTGHERMDALRYPLAFVQLTFAYGYAKAPDHPFDGRLTWYRSGYGRAARGSYRHPLTYGAR